MRRMLLAAAMAVVIAMAAPCEAKKPAGKSRAARSVHAKTAFRKAHPCPATGRASGACPGYVIDHVVPLKRGGADQAVNMQWQTLADARAKDRWE